MSLILIVSIIIRLLALGVAVVLWRRLRDWRVGFLAVMVGLMALRQTLTLLKEPLAVPILLDVEAHLEELPGLVVSIFVLFAIVFLGRMILESKRAQELVQRSRDYAESIVDTVRAPLLVLDGELRVILAGNYFYQNFGVTPEETEGRLLFDLGDKQWDIPRLRELLKQVLPKNTKVEDFEVEHEIPTIGRRIMLLNAQRMYRRENKTQMILLTIEDIIERKQAVQRLRDSEARLAGAQRLAKLGYWGWELDTAAISFHTDVLADVFGTPPDQMPTTVDEYCRWIHPDDVERMAKPCLSGLHPHPLGLEWAQTGYRGARHGCSRPRRSPIPAFATRVPATFPR